MKASELIKELQELINKHGDKGIFFYSYFGNQAYPVCNVEFSKIIDMYMLNNFMSIAEE